MAPVIKFSCLYLALYLSNLLLAEIIVAQNPPPPTSESEDAIFERVFGRPRTGASSQSIIVPLIIDDREQATIRIIFIPNQPQKTRIQTQPVLETLKPILRPEVLANIQVAIANAPEFPIEILQKNGLEANFDEQRLSLFLQISPSARATNILGDRSNLPPEAKNAIPISALSGYATYRTKSCK